MGAYFLPYYRTARHRRRPPRKAISKLLFSTTGRVETPSDESVYGKYLDQTRHFSQRAPSQLWSASAQTFIPAVCMLRCLLHCCPSQIFCTRYWYLVRYIYAQTDYSSCTKYKLFLFFQFNHFTSYLNPQLVGGVTLSDFLDKVSSEVCYSYVKSSLLPSSLSSIFQHPHGSNNFH